MTKWLERAGLVLLGAILAWAGLRFLGGPDAGPESGFADPAEREAAEERRLALAEERFRTEMNLALTGFLRLVDFREFAERGRDVSLVVPVGGDASRERILAAGAGAIRVPEIVVDTAARRRWATLGQRLESLGEGVDPDVKAAFDDIRTFLSRHPFPRSPNLATVSESPWSRPEVVDRWLDLNDALHGAVMAVLARFGAAG